MKSSVSLGNLHQIVGGKSLEVPKSQLTIHKDVRSEGSVKSAEGVLKKSESESDLAGEKNKQYIDPRMVESILQHQGLHRNNSSCSSSSSLDSEMLLNKLMSKKSTGMNLTIDIPFDSVSLSSQRDSAYGSSDRHSASSVGSGSTDPYSQSFSTKAPVASHYSQVCMLFTLVGNPPYSLLFSLFLCLSLSLCVPLSPILSLWVSVCVSSLSFCLK